MPRYFIEVAYKGTGYSGFQIQANADTIQSEIEKAFNILHHSDAPDQIIFFTGSSRTDAGVHALQNYFHFDYDKALNPHFLYKMNAILPLSIVIKTVHCVPATSHCRFDATSREYIYTIHRLKNPFLQGESFFFPYKIDVELMKEAAQIIEEQTNFFAFSKTNTQVNNFNCRIIKSQWLIEKDVLVYNIEANRFLRGMVRSITATLLKLGRNKLSMQQFQNLFQHQCKAGYSVPAHGLFLKAVNYPENYFL